MQLLLAYRIGLEHLRPIRSQTTIFHARFQQIMTRIPTAMHILYSTVLLSLHKSYPMEHLRISWIRMQVSSYFYSLHLMVR